MDKILTKKQEFALRNLNIASINEMQRAAVMHGRGEGDMILLSPTGSGKTLAYMLPMLERMEPDVKKVQAVVVVPTRELAKQAGEVWRSMKLPEQMVMLYGGRPVEQEAAVFSGSSPAVVVGTPGRLIEHPAVL